MDARQASAESFSRSLHLRFKVIIVSVYLPLSFFLSQYRSWFGLDLTFLGLLFVLVALALDGRVAIRLQKDFMLFTMLVMCSVAISVVRGGGIWFNVYHYLSAIVLVVGIMVTSAYVDHRLLWRVYWVLGSAAMTLLFYQAVLVYGSGSEVTPVALLPIAERDIRLWQPAPRPSSFFTEPQYYSTFMLPLVLHGLLRRKYVAMSLVILSILLSASSFGVLSCVMLLAWYVVGRGHAARRRVVAVAAGVAVIVVLQYVDVFATAYEKISRIDPGTDDRIAKAMLLVLAQPLDNIVFGLPMPVDEFITANIEELPFLWSFLGTPAESQIGYITTLFGVLLVYGIVVWIALSWLWVNVYRRASILEQRGVLILVVLHSAATTILFNYPFYFYYTLLLSYPVLEVDRTRRASRVLPQHLAGPMVPPHATGSVVTTSQAYRWTE